MLRASRTCDSPKLHHPLSHVEKQYSVVFGRKRFLDKRPKLLMNRRSDPFPALFFTLKLQNKAVVRSSRCRSLQDRPQLDHLGVNESWLLRRGRCKLAVKDIEHLFLLGWINTEVD